MDKNSFLDELKRIPANRIVLFIGTGLVKSLGYPLWGDFLRMSAEFARKFSPEVCALMEARLKRADLLNAADPLFGPEITRSELHAFLRTCFDRNPTIPHILKNLFACPFAAFVTTNFDRTIEQSMTASTKTPESHSDKLRFRDFNSRFPVYAEDTPQSRQNGLVLKLHGDISIPDEIVLSYNQFAELRRNDSFNFFYRNSLSSATLIFIGFSGNDPNFTWHLESIHDICGVPARTSYFLHPDNETPPSNLMGVNVTEVLFSAQDEFKEFYQILQDIIDCYSGPAAGPAATIIRTADEPIRNTLAFLCTGLESGTHSSSYQCAITSMVAEAASIVGGIDNEPKLLETISRTYHVSARDAKSIWEQADRAVVTSALNGLESAKTRFARKIRTLRDGIKKRSKAFGKPFAKTDEQTERIVLDVLVRTLSKTGMGLALSLVDSEPPESSLLDRVLRTSIEQIANQGLGDLDKEVLISAFADLFARPTKDEGLAIVTLAQIFVAHSLAVTFSGGLEKILELMPSEAYLDANVAIPLVAEDHPRSSHYHDLVVSLKRIRCDAVLLDVFLEEMVHNSRIAYREMEVAKIKNRENAKDYAEFHGPLTINPFVAGYASGGKEGEKFSSYMKRKFGSDVPTTGDFSRELKKLGIDVVSTRGLNRAPSEPLAIHIASEKNRLMRVRAQVLAEHEACQVLWIHTKCQGKHVWFVTEDAALRRILRALSNVQFSQDPPSRGVMPAYGAHLLISSITDRPSLEGTFSQLLWNPTYMEQVDSMLSAVLRKLPGKIKELRQLDLLHLREKAYEIIQRESAKTESDVIKRRAEEYLHGRDQILTSVLRELGEE